MEKVIIVGSGCAGLTAAIYAARANLAPLVLEGAQPGGQLSTTTLVENFPGFADGIDGPQLILNMHAQAEKFGARFSYAEATGFEPLNSHVRLQVDDKEWLETESLIIASGASARWLVWLALVLDIANAGLVGIGRYHTGLGAAVGSRYQYVPLFCLASAVAIVVDGFVGAVRAPLLARAVTIALPILLAWSVASRWPEQMRSWSGWRGTQLRLLLQTSRDATRLPYVAGVSTAEAAVLCDTFHLH